SETIPSDVKINGLVSLKGQAVISSDDGYVRVGDLTGGDGKRSLMLRSGDLDSVVVSQSGDVGVGVPNAGIYSGKQSKLDVNGRVAVQDLWLKSTGKLALSSCSLTCQILTNTVNCPAGYEKTGEGSISGENAIYCCKVTSS
ncbi:MAG: hypothetical protein Q7S27_01395, partial [Nanoarchaeota archaeon]|nr:hypothetical protein [Nanoarchaeota archaeon]